MYFTKINTNVLIVYMNPQWHPLHRKSWIVFLWWRCMTQKSHGFKKNHMLTSHHRNLTSGYSSFSGLHVGSCHKSNSKHPQRAGVNVHGCRAVCLLIVQRLSQHVVDHLPAQGEVLQFKLLLFRQEECQLVISNDGTVSVQRLKETKKKSANLPLFQVYFHFKINNDRRLKPNVEEVDDYLKE